MVYMEKGDFLITMLDLWTVSLSISCLSETIYVYIYLHIYDDYDKVDIQTHFLIIIIPHLSGEGC